MGKKYIIELEDKPFHNGNGDFLYRVKGFNSLVFDMTGVGKLTPYTEPDLEQVKRDYDAWYEKGLADAWDAARTLWNTPNRKEIFGHTTFNTVLTTLTASESIEKIRQYEQEREKIRVGDEVKSGDEKYIVLQKYLNNIDELMVVLFNKRDGEIDTWHMYNANGVIFEKTGRHFQEIAEVLRKMKES